MISGLQNQININTEDISANAQSILGLGRTVNKLREDVDAIDTEGNSYYHTVTQDENTGNYLLTLHEVHPDDTESIASETPLPAGGGGGQ